MQVGNGVEKVWVELNKLRCHISTYRFSTRIPFPMMRITGKFVKYLEIEWPQFKIIQNDTNLEDKLQTKTKLNFLQAKKLQRIIEGQFWTIMCVRNGEIIQKMEIEVESTGQAEAVNATAPDFCELKNEYAHATHLYPKLNEEVAVQTELRIPV